MKNFKTYMKLKQLAVIFFLLFHYFGTAQNVSFEKSNFEGNKDYKKAHKNYLKGKDYYDKKNYSIALNYLLPANDFNPDNAELNFMIGDCYLHSIYKDKTLKYLKRSWELDPEFSKEIHWMLGQAYQYNYKFKEAKKEYYEFKVSLSSSDLFDWAERIEKKMTECSNGIILMANPTGGMVVNLKAINSEASEYGPVITADGKTMYFTSRREGSTGGKIDHNDFQPYEDIYFTTTKDGHIWSKPQNIGPPINTKTHDATVGISPDGKILLVYRGDINGGDIFYTTHNGNNWSKPIAFPPPINSPAHENSASFSPDKKTLYFVSDRPGGFGGRDIYVVSKDDQGVWGNAENLGDKINTKYDEDGVFLHPDGKTLYFSSKGHNTMGGHDIFYSVKDKNGNWSEPKNMGFPINSPDNDVFFVVTADRRKGYYSSVRRDGTGEKDIFVINFSTGTEKKINRDRILIQGKITDEQDSSVHADIEIYDADKDTSIGKYHSDKETGEYQISLPLGKNYRMSIKKDNYLVDTENVNTKGKNDLKNITKNIKLQKAENTEKTENTVQVEKTEKTEKTKEKVCTEPVFKNIYFDYGDAILKENSFSILTKVITFMKDNPDAKIELSGYTDDVSSLATNQPLSKDRAKAVKDYLVKNGISASRIISKSYADKHPIADNDTEEGRAKNRRVEIKILEK